MYIRCINNGYIKSKYTFLALLKKMTAKFKMATTIYIVLKMSFIVPQPSQLPSESVNLPDSVHLLDNLSFTIYSFIAKSVLPT